MTNNDELALILVAAGSSARIGFDKTGTKIKKEYLPMNGGTVLSSAAKAFLSTLNFSTVVVTFPSAENSVDLKDANYVMTIERCDTDDVDRCKYAYLEVYDEVTIK